MSKYNNWHGILTDYITIRIWRLLHRRILRWKVGNILLTLRDFLRSRAGVALLCCYLSKIEKVTKTLILNRKISCFRRKRFARVGSCGRVPGTSRSWRVQGTGFWRGRRRRRCAVAREGRAPSSASGFPRSASSWLNGSLHSLTHPNWKPVPIM